jgi:DNA-binding NtrC family response regulator
VSAGTSNAEASRNGVQYGDYTGLGFAGGVIHPAWADNSNSAGAVRDVLRGGSPPPPAPTALGRPLSEALDDYERGLLRAALAQAEGNIAEAARLLRTDRANLYRRLRRLSLDRE